MFTRRLNGVEQLEQKQMLATVVDAPAAVDAPAVSELNLIEIDGERNLGVVDLIY